MKNKRWFRWAIGFGLISNLLLFSGCSGQDVAEENNSKLTVAVTIPPQKAFVEAVCGDLADVIILVPPGNSPGNYEPTPQEMASFSQAAVYFTIGVPTEKANILPKAKDIEMDIVDLAEVVSKQFPDREFSPGNRDPHIWLSPRRAKIMVEAISATMISLDQENAQIYEENTERYLSQLDSVDQAIQAGFEAAKKQTFIVFHPSYGYFAEDYGLEMVSLEQDGKEATAQHLQAMIDLAKKENIKVIFSQAEIDSKQPDAFAEEIGGEKVMLEPLSQDYITNLNVIGKAIAGALQ